jgi:hypothetical protein
MAGFSTISPTLVQSPVMSLQEEVAAFQRTLPNVQDIYKTLPSLQFFALCPNGKRIPVESICAEYEKDPNGLVLRTLDDRIVLVIQAMRSAPDQINPYWQQAFYLSTGESSGKKATWLPFDGILMEDSLYRNTNTPTVLYSSPWFSKGSFCISELRSDALARFSTDLKVRKRFALKDVYGKVFLPEGHVLYPHSRFDRFGTISYLLGSHAIGGNAFQFKMGEHYFNSFYSYNNEDNRIPNPAVDGLVAILDQPSPVQGCFLKMLETYPISKANEVNNYIDKHKAISYMNAFRSANIFPPGLSFANIPIPALGYSMPSKTYALAVENAVNDLFIQYKLGEIPLEQVKQEFANPAQQVKEYIKKFHKTCIMPNEPQYKYALKEGVFPKYKNYFGGKRKTRRSRKLKRKTRRNTRM